MNQYNENRPIGKDIIGNIHVLLEELSRRQSIEPLKQLFWSELNYDRANKTLSRAKWRESTANLLAEDSLLFATGGENAEVPIIYSRLKSDYLSTSEERYIVTQLLKDYLEGLFIFSNVSRNRWHFINVKADDRDAKRRLFRRITIGPEERLRTASERIAMLDLASMAQTSRLSILQWHEEAFNVEAVTKRFFDEYRILFSILQKDLSKQTDDKAWAHDYALQFLSRCMFLYFIQRKGWLGNDKNFLKSFWESYNTSKHEKDTFFKDWLQVLFFEAFNNKYHGGHTHFPPSIDTVLATAPYLNGGLFSHSKLDQVDYLFNIADERFQQAFMFFEKYNFTISEDSPLDQEVAVDPEMIGRVYESLVNVSTEIDEQGDAGIFYTPRTEIDLMCRLALVDYLANHLGQERKNVLYDVVFALEPEEKSSTDDHLQALNLWNDLYHLLHEVTMVDPACGSGAFLVGMLYVLNDLQERADQYRSNDEREGPYERKKRIIGRSLYGVDVMEWAAHIAELRLWLALIIDVDIPLEELHVRRDPLLPHLTFKVRYGDSLVQEVGGLNFGYKRTLGNIPPILKRRLETLKEEKAKFYYHDPSCEFRTREAAIQTEVNLFRDIIRERKHDLEKELHILYNPPMQPELLAGPPPSQALPDTTERQNRIEEKEREKRDLDKALQALVSPKQIPFVWDIAFVEVFSGINDGFDIVIGNPPYVRQEQISKPDLPRNEVTTENKQAYKKKLASTIYHDFQDFFQYRPGTGKVGHEIDAKSDLYIYFYLHGLKLLNSKGSFCFITSNSWLDVGYGADLQEFLLKSCYIKMIIDNQMKRSFATADVNTVITLFSTPVDKPDQAGINHIARFVMFKVGFEHVLRADIFKNIEQASQRSSTDEYRVYPINQRKLLVEGYRQPEEPEDNETEQITQSRTNKDIARRLVKEALASYTTNKWGGKYLRAPAIYWTILEKAKDKLVRLGDIAEVRFGIKTGANEFFYLDATKIRQWKIEAEFLQPAIKSPRECRSILIDPGTLRTKIFMCHKNKEELRGTAALKYIEWGESQRFDKRPSCAGRIRWWDLGVRHTPSLGFNYLIDTTAKTLYAPNGCYFSDNFQEVSIANQLVLPLCVSLNSTLFQLMVNVAGRVNFGDGLLKIQTYEVSDLFCVNPTRIEFQNSNIFSSVDWDVLHPSSDRRKLDAIIFNTLGLTQNEQDTIYEAVIDMVQSRLEKARSFKVQQERNKRMEAVEKTLGIWIGLPQEIMVDEVENNYA